MFIYLIIYLFKLLFFGNEQFVAAVLALAVVDAGVVVDRKGGNFAYAVNTLPYVQHVLPYYPAPLHQLVNPVAAEVKAVKPQTVLPFVNPFYPSLAPYPLINPVQVKTDTEAVPSPFLHRSPYAYSVLPFGFASNLVVAGYEPFPSVAVAEQVKETEGEVDTVQVVEAAEPVDSVVVETD